jgi:hypothetical protein
MHRAYDIKRCESVHPMLRRNLRAGMTPVFGRLRETKQ